MADWDRAKVLAALEAFKLTGANAAVAAYWLALWDGDRPPHRGLFNPARVRDMLPAIGFTQVHTDGDNICRLAGRFIDMAFGRPMRGMNLLELVNGDERRLRNARLKTIVDGHLGLSHTRYETEDHATAVAEPLQLPFFGTAEDGSRQYLTHTSWRPGPSDYLARERPKSDGRPDTYLALSILKD
jgi:hypothetical protein